MNENDFITSLCISTTTNAGPRLLRIADVRGRRLAPFEDYSNSWNSKETPLICCPSQSALPDGTIAFWKWVSRPFEDDPFKYRTRSWPYPEFKPIKYLPVPGISNLDGLKQSLLRGIKMDLSFDQGKLVGSSEENGKSICVDYDPENFHRLNGLAVLKKDVYTLNVYEIPAGNIKTADSKVLPRNFNHCNLKFHFHYYLNLDMPTTTQTIIVRSNAETVKQVILNRIRLFTSASKNERRMIKDFIDEHCNNIVDTIAEECKCTSEEAKKLYDEFSREYGRYFTEEDFESDLVRKLVESNRDVADKFKQIVREEWNKENASLIQKAEEDHQAAEEQKKLWDAEIALLEAQYEEVVKSAQNADEIAAKIQDRIADAKQDITAFLAEYSIYTSPSAMIAETSCRERSSLVYGKNISTDPETITKDDLLDDLCENLEKVGVGKHARALGSFLLAAYFTKTPLIVAGFGSEVFMDALSATLFNRTAHRFYASGDALGAAEAHDGIIVAYDAFGAMNKILDTALSDNLKRYVCFISQTSEELEIEPRSLLNYALPLFAEFFITDTPRPSDLIGTLFEDGGDSFVVVNSMYRNTRIPEDILPTFARKRAEILVATAKKILAELTEIEKFKLVTLPIMLVMRERDKLHELISKMSDGEKNELLALIGEPQ